MKKIDEMPPITIPCESNTRPSSGPRGCNHRDTCGDSTVETFNGSSWCVSCGALVKGETQ